MMKDVVDYEPHIALFLENPKHFLSDLITQAQERLIEGGKLYMETLPSLSETILSDSIAKGWKNGKIEKDLSGKERFIILTR